VGGCSAQPAKKASSAAAPRERHWFMMHAILDGV